MNKAEIFLRQALKVATTHRGFCSPNPSVGAVVVKNGKVLATGVHRGAGKPHAEVDALQHLGEKTRGAELYVTLEPCCHHGRTPPCTDLIISSGIQSVYYGYRDPNPIVSKHGAKILNAAGISTRQIKMPEIKAFYRSYRYWILHKKPWVTAKIAMSLDGKIAGPNGECTKITGLECRDFTHNNRLHSDALLTTAKTIHCDNPRLDVRLEKNIAKPVYILDGQLNTPLSAQIFSANKRVTLFYDQCLGEEKTIPYVKAESRCIPVSRVEYGLAWDDVLTHIGADGVHDLWVEAGGRCYQSLHETKHVHRSLMYIGQKWLGDQSQPAFSGSVDVFSKASKVKWKSLGRDVVCEMEWV